MKEKGALTEGEHDASVATEAPQANLEPLVATTPQPVASLSKKGKKQ